MAPPAPARAARRRGAGALRDVLDLGGAFAYLSLLTVGGGLAAYPELQQLAVERHGWVTEAQLLHFYSLGRLAPGPNMMLVASIGATVAAVPGAIVALVAFLLPTGLLTFAVGRLWTRLADWPWRTAIQRGLGPVAVGLVLAGTVTLGRAALDGPLAIGLAVTVLALLLRTGVNAALPIVACGLIGLAAHVL